MISNYTGFMKKWPQLFITIVGNVHLLNWNKICLTSKRLSLPSTANSGNFLISPKVTENNISLRQAIFFSYAHLQNLRTQTLKTSNKKSKLMNPHEKLPTDPALTVKSGEKSPENKQNSNFPTESYSTIYGSFWEVKTVDIFIAEHFEMFDIWGFIRTTAEFWSGKFRSRFDKLQHRCSKFQLWILCRAAISTF